VRGLSPADQASARTSLGSALDTATHLSHDVATRLTSAADHAFVTGVHYAAYTGAFLAACAAYLVYRFLPREIEQHGATAGPVQAAENVAEMALAGVSPVFADTGIDDAVPAP
jgi:hypothetical protein